MHTATGSVRGTLSLQAAPEAAHGGIHRCWIEGPTTALSTCVDSADSAGAATGDATGLAASASPGQRDDITSAATSAGDFSTSMSHEEKQAGAFEDVGCLHVRSLQNEGLGRADFSASYSVDMARDVITREVLSWLSWHELQCRHAACCEISYGALLLESG